MTKISIKMNDNNLRKAKNFFSNYDLILVYGDSIQKFYLGNENNRVCRFCKGDSKNVTFRKDAHVIPQFMGNENLLSYFECDNCNSLFSKYEDSFARFLGVTRTISQIKNKNKKVPKFKDSNSSLQVEISDNVINMSSIVGDEVWSMDEENKSFTLKTKKTAYIPIYIPKLLIKLGFSMIPETDLENFEITRKFLIENDSNEKYKDMDMLRIFSYFIPGPPVFDKPFIQLFKSKNKKLPTYQIILYYYNYQFQINIPFAKNDEHLQGTKIEMPIAPLLVDNDTFNHFGVEKFQNLNLSSTIKNTNEPQNIIFSYESFKEVEIEKNPEE